MIWQASFTTALLGGLCIGTSASLLLLFSNRVAGISGMVAGLLTPLRAQVLWRAMFVLGLLLGGLFAWRMWPGQLPILPRPTVFGAVTLLVAGVLVGFGTRLGDGCTSGHGVCGISRGSLRSIVATLTFIACGALAVFGMRVLAGVHG